MADLVPVEASLSPPSSLIEDKSRLLGKGGMRLVKQLFIEYAAIGEYNNAVYTMHREDEVVDGITYPSLHRLYVETNDITEARFVDLYLYDWQQWNSIASSAPYRDEVARWRTDIKAKVMGELVDSLLLDAHSGSKSSKSSAKFLVDKLSKKGPGKPTTAVVPTTEESVSRVTTEINDDLKRLRLVN